MDQSLTQERPLAAVFRRLGSESMSPVVETFDRSKTIFFPGDPAERVYFLLKGAVKLSRVYEAGKKLRWRCYGKIAYSGCCLW